jgi:hypothetical protein
MGGLEKMIAIDEAAFVRLGYSGDETFAEVEVRSGDFKAPLIATFKQAPSGALQLVNVTEKREDHKLDWYENNLHEAYPGVMGKLFSGPEGEAERMAFERQVLSFQDVRETIEETIFYGN